MKGEKLRIVIDEATGEVSVEANGFVGHGCAEVIDKVSAALGKVTEEKLKPEYHTTTRKATVTRGN